MDKNEVIMEILADENDDLLCEMALIGRICDKHNVPKYALVVDECNTYIGNPYFKIFNSSNRGNATEVARISFLEPKILVHKGLPQMKITKSIAKLINDFLAAKNKRNKHRTNWQEAIAYYNDYNGRVDNVDVDFDELTQEVIDKNPELFKYCLPIDLPIPDYTELS